MNKVQINFTKQIKRDKDFSRLSQQDKQFITQLEKSENKDLTPEENKRLNRLHKKITWSDF